MKEGGAARGLVRERAVLDLSGLSPYSHGPQGPSWWGMLGLVAIEGMVFATFIASYFYLRMGEPEWPPGALEPPELLLPTINTVVLIASSASMYWAEQRIKKGDGRGLALGVLLGIVLAMAFQIIKAIEYSMVEFWWDTNAYGSIVWLMIGFHSAHVMAVILKAVVVDVLAWRGYFDQERRLGVTINGIYWHFVVVVWIPLYLVIYWAPRLL